MLDIIYGLKYAYHIFTTKNNGEFFLFLGQLSISGKFYEAGGSVG